jgi:transposase InsO family protein
MADWKTYLASIYFDPKHPASYTSPEKLYDVVKSEGKHRIGRYRIRKWLQDQEAYSLTRGARRRFGRTRVIVEGVDSQWDADLMDMANITKDNDGIRYVLVMIDIFSRFLWCRPLKTKRGLELVQAFKSIFVKGRKPVVLRTDRGSEFTNKDVQKYLKERDVRYFTAYNETKANYAERVIKTLKHKIFRYILKNQSYRYKDVLQDLVTSYNRTVHRSLGATPESITVDDELESRLRQYLLRQKEDKIKPKKSRPQPYKYKMGEVVRISHIRGVFDREYSQKWTGELFRVTKRYRRQGIPIYTLRDWSGDDIDGTFYTSELQSVHVNENTTYKIENVIERRTRRGKKEVLVHWLHWPKKYDSWILETEIRGYQL